MRSVASCREHEEESPGNIEHHTPEREVGGDVGKMWKKITASCFHRKSRGKGEKAG